MQRAAAAIIALSIVWLVLQGFNAFLAAMQKVLDIEAKDPAPAPAAPVPVYVVDEPAPADGSPAQAGGRPPATP